MSNSDNLKSMGLKATLPRLKILALFEKTEVRHLTAEDVYRLLLALLLFAMLYEWVPGLPSLAAV